MADIFFGLTDTGKVRVNNEDTFIAQTVMNDRFILACAIDGVGGYSGGEVAAALAKESILEHFSRTVSNIPEMMKDALLIANERIYAERRQVREHESMACVLTLAVVDVESNEFYYIHVGDTRLYLLRDNSLVKLTKDQSFVGFLEDTGRLSEDAAMRHPKRNEINKALGFGGELAKDGDYLESGHSPFLPGDMILLCSDGLTDMVNKNNLTNILTNENSLEEKAKELIDTANKNGGRDNITAVLVKNDKPLQEQQATMPVPNGKKKVILEQSPVIAELKEEEPLIIEKVPNLPKNNLALTLLSLICIGLLATSLYLLWELGRQEKVLKTESLDPLKVSQSPSEIQFREALNSMQGDTLILNDSVFKEPILLTDNLPISKDTLYILARGKIVFKRDSSYKGPALVIRQGSRQLVLDNLVFENFDVGISSESKGLSLVGVQFINCRIPVQYSFNLIGQKYMNGSLSDLFLRTDPLADTLNN